MSLNSVLQTLTTRIATECKSLRTLIGQAAPPGVISPYGGSAAPTGWLLCDGSAVSRTTYAALFAAIGTTYGAGNGSSTFNLPDGRVRTLVGAGTGKTLGANDGVAEASRNARYSHDHAHTSSASISSASAGTPSVSVSVANHASHTHSMFFTSGAGGTHNHTIPQATVATDFKTPNTGTSSVLRQASFNGHDHGGVTGDESTHAHIISGTSAAESATLTHSVTVTPSALPPHSHTVTPTVDSGGSNDHPFLAINYIIKT